MKNVDFDPVRRPSYMVIANPGDPTARIRSDAAKQRTGRRGHDGVSSDKPEGFRFKPGQSIDFTLIDSTAGDQQGKSHTFSLVSPRSRTV
jgi:hypothetical protein